MDEPFRESSEIVLRVDAKSTMDKLDAAEPAPFLFRLAITPLGLYVPTEGGFVSSPKIRKIAEELQFSYFGRFSFIGMFFEKMPREVWVDEKSGAVILTLRRSEATGFIEKQMSTYNFETMFDDGSVVITWSRPDVDIFEKNDRLVDLPGTGDLTADYETHLRAVTKHAEKGARALQISDMQTALRVKAWDDSRLRPRSVQIRARARLLVFSAVLGVLFMLIRRFI